jgi:hypothetical protein
MQYYISASLFLFAKLHSNCYGVMFALPSESKVAGRYAGAGNIH